VRRCSRCQLPHNLPWARIPCQRPTNRNVRKQSMARMTGGEAIVDSLLRHGIDTVFGLPGVQTYGLFDAFARASNRLRLINARHEQTTAYMALGYACATGRPAAYAVVPGPG